MKRIAILLLAAVMMVSMTIVIPTDTVFAAGNAPAKLKWSTDPGMKSIKLKWKKKNVSYYNVYRVYLKGKTENTIMPLPFASYKKVAKVSGKKTSWTDKKVKAGQFYAYVIRGYKKGGKLACDSYMEGVIDYDCAGLVKPAAGNLGTGESYDNTTSRLYINVYRGLVGVKPSGAAVYRKTGPKGKFKKISPKKLKRNSEMDFSFRDTTVKPGKVYYYKAKTWVKKNGKKKYSAYSNTVRIPATNATGRFTVKAISPSGTTGSFDVLVTSSHQYNGSTVFYPGKIWNYVADKKGYIAKLTQYSSDGKTWTQIPSGGITLAAKQQVYLRYTFASSAAVFQAGFADDALYTEVGVKYDGNAGYGRLMDLQLGNGSGKAWNDEDL